MPTSELTTELKSLLREEQQVAEKLLAALEREPEAIEVVGLMESLALLDQRRAGVLDRFRIEASSTRQRVEERSIRQFVLRALADIGVPQTSGFLEDYLYARELLVLKTRGMGALRRDEYRAWGRLRDRPRAAYVVPCLDETGRAVARWMSRSDWPLEDRIMVDGAESVWSLHRVRALIDAYRDGAADADALFLPLIERYANESLDSGFGAPERFSGGGLPELATLVGKKIASLERTVGPAQGRVAKVLAKASVEERLWGVRDR